MNRLLLSGSLIVALMSANPAFAGGFGVVSNGNNDGPGSLRSALESGASSVKIRRSVKYIIVSEPLEYNGSKKLRLVGSGQVIDGSAIAANEDILRITQGVDTSISDLTFIGNHAEVNENPSIPVGGKGIYINVPVERTGVVRVKLDTVTVMRVGNHGIHISDCSLGDDCGGGSGGGGDGSAASIYVDLQNVVVNNVGFGKADADGVRVDDRGDGSIYFSARNSAFINVGADGVELDEGNNGDVVVDVKGSLFDSNGEYCVLVPFVPGSPCDDDGDPDVDDGFDIDEAGDGTLFAQIRNSDVTNNFDEGLDFDEEDEGGIEVTLANILAAGNEDEGIKTSEEDGGDVIVKMRAVTTVDNNGSKEGIELEEENAGNVTVVVSDTNLIGGDDEDLKVEQGDEGEGTLKVRRSNITSLDLEGVQEI